MVGGAAPPPIPPGGRPACWPACRPASRPADLVDPWERPMALEFSSNSEIESGGEDVLATLRSDGRDGRRGTDDDVVLVILTDGQVRDEATYLGAGTGDD